MGSNLLCTARADMPFREYAKIWSTCPTCENHVTERLRPVASMRFGRRHGPGRKCALVCVPFYLALADRERWKSVQVYNNSTGYIDDMIGK